MGDAASASAAAAASSDDLDDLAAPSSRRRKVENGEAVAGGGADESDDDGDGDDDDDDDDDDDGGAGAGSSKPAAAAAAAAAEDDDDDEGFGRKRQLQKARKVVRRPAAAAAGPKKKKPAAAGKKAGASKKRRRTDDKNRYIEAAAAEAGEDDDEADSDAEQYRAARKGLTTSQYEAAVVERLRKEQAAVRARREKALSAEEIAANFVAKHAAGAYDDADEGVDAEGLEASLAEQALLPDMRDPKLWMLRCKENQETYVLIALLNKFVAKSEVGEGGSMGIMSAFSTSKSTVFVEAYRESQVKQAVAGVQDLYGWKEGAIQLVPIQQMTAALRVDAHREIFRPDAFVRMTSGAYKGDLAQVVQVADGGASLTVRLVPRLDLLARKAAAEAGAAGGRFRGRGRPGAFGRGPRPPQRLFDWDDVREVLGSLVGASEVKQKGSDREQRTFAGSSFGAHDGLLYKEVKRHQVTSSGEPSTADEVKFFPAGRARAGEALEDAEEGDEDDEEGGRGRGRGRRPGAGAGTGDDAGGDAVQAEFLQSLQRARTGVGAVSTPLALGDSVYVQRGDLAGIMGTVVSVNAAAATFSLEASAESVRLLGLGDDVTRGAPLRLEVPLAEAVKTFRVGDHVMIMGGVYKGETGGVLRVRSMHGGGAVAGTEDGADDPDADLATQLASVLLDSGQRTVDVFVQDMALTTEFVTSVASVDGYAQHDLVEVPGLTEAAGQLQVGCIVALGAREVQVLLPTGTVKSLPVASLRGKVAPVRRRQAGDDSTVGAAVDVAGMALNVGDIVRVLQGEHQGLTGTITHVFRAYLFLHNFMLGHINSGMFVKRCRHVMLTTLKVAITRPLNVPHAAGGTDADSHVTVLGSTVGRPQTRGGGQQGPDHLGKTVLILKGRYKQQQGTIRNIVGGYYSVEIDSGQQKHVTLSKDDCRIIGDKHGSLTRGGSRAVGAGGVSGLAGSIYNKALTPAMFEADLGGVTPGYGGGVGIGHRLVGGMTPMVRQGATPSMGGLTMGMTPMYGARGADRGGATPMYGQRVLADQQRGGATPMYGGIGGATPMYAAGSQTPMYEALTEAGAGAGSRTPRYGATGEAGSQTPMYGRIEDDSGAGEYVRKPVVALSALRDEAAEIKRLEEEREKARADREAHDARAREEQAKLRAPVDPREEHLQAVRSVAEIVGLQPGLPYSWCSPGVKVSIAEGQYGGKKAVIVSASATSNKCTVKIDTSGASVQVQVKDLRPVCAGLADADVAVLVLTGDRAGQRAVISSIDGVALDSADVVVQFSGGDLEVLPNLRTVVIVDPATK